MKHLKKYNENKFWYKNISDFLIYIDSLQNNTFLFIDTETTGLGGPKKQQLTQIAAIAMNPINYNFIDSYNQKIKLNKDIKDILDEPIQNSWNRRKVLSFNRYGDKIKGKSYIDENVAIKEFSIWVNNFKNPIFVIQNAEFDMAMFNGKLNKRYPVLDTKQILQLYIIPLYQKLSETSEIYKNKLKYIGISNRDNGLTSSSMSKWAPEFNISTEGYHDALYDCKMMMEMYKNMINLLKENEDLDISKYQIERIKAL
ncbi:3'-5' exonuclease [Candidatus Dojkabacteria bacterium]|jgi:DNA polymerase III alpha subunit (gram-positive type)|nr:3'-5' exonuclease [Candidatus Dojkabacteria bacterium]